MSNSDHVLGLTRISASKYLDKFVKSLEVCGDRPFNVVFDDAYPISFGKSDNFTGDKSILTVGRKGLFKSKNPFSPVSDISFMRVAATIFHEYGHYLENFDSKYASLATAMSEVSVVDNKWYYVNFEHVLPHEIVAEDAGVGFLFDAMEFEFGDKGIERTLYYVNTRASDESEESYMFKKPYGFFKDRESVCAAFSEASEKSLDEPRKEQSHMARCDDEFRHLVLPVGLREPVPYHYDQLSPKTVVGAERDRMMASLAIHLHPELLDEHPILKNEDLSIVKVFGRPFFETSTESRARLGVGIDVSSRSTVAKNLIARDAYERMVEFDRSYAKEHDLSIVDRR